MGEGRLVVALGHKSPQGITAGHAVITQGVRQGDGLAVLVQGHQHRHVTARTGNAHLHTIGDPVEQVDGVQGAAQQLVAYRRPGRFARRQDADPVAAVESHAGSDDQ